MENFICVQCGVQFDETAEPPSRCPICEDERQFVRHSGQEWTTLKRLQTDHRNRLEDEASQLLGIGTEPEFAIGQRALLLQSSEGNLLWDCITLLDDRTAAEVDARGGLRAIAISHPHYLLFDGRMGRMFRRPNFFAFGRSRMGNAQESAHAILGRNNPFALGWANTNQCGGHFEGGTVLHWPTGANGRGALLTGDIIQVVQDRRYVSFHAQLSESDSARADRDRSHPQNIEPFSFEQIYGAWWKANVLTDSKAAVARSAERYLRWISR